MATAQGQSRHHECALCMERYTSPRLLPCFHTFCVGCLQRLVQSRGRSRTFPCPSCRTTVDIPPGGVKKFQVNFYIEAEGQDTGSGAKVHTCKMCGKNPASHKCAECDQLACDTCTAIHASIAATRSHTVVQLKKGAHSAVKVTKERYCATHKDEKIRFFCNHCSTVICRDCKLTSHEGHASTDLSAKSSEAKQLILQVTKRSQEKLEPKLRQRLEGARDHQSNMQKKKREILALLEKRAEELKRNIDESLSQAKQQLDQATGSLNTTIATCIDSMNMELVAFLSLTEHAEIIAQNGCEADILDMPRQMRDFFQDGGEQVSANFVNLQVQQSILEMSWQIEQVEMPWQITQYVGEVSPDNADLQQVQQSMRRKPLRVETSSTTGCKSASKLKSFTNSKWKAVVQMEENKTQKSQCWNCFCRYDKKLQHCPDCRQARNAQHGYNSYYGNQAGNKQCGSCLGMYAQYFQSCPSCGVAGEDVKDAAQRAIPEYIGRVTKIEAEEQDTDEGDCDDLWAYDTRQQLQQQQLQFFPHGMLPVQTVKKKKDILANQILKEIRAIQSCLSQWQGVQ